MSWGLQAKRWLDKRAGSLLLTLLAVPARLLGWLMGRSHSLTPPPRNVLFVKLMGMGSVLLAADSIAALRRHWPEARFILLTSRSLRQPLEATGLFDDFLLVDDRSPLRLAASAAAALLRCWRLPALWVFDLEVYSRLTPVFSLLTLARNRFGFLVEVVGGRRHLNTHSVYFNRLRGVSENYAEMARAAGAEVQPNSWQFPAFPAQRQLKRRPYLAINNTCSALSLERKLTDEQLAEVCRHLLARSSYDIALLGSPADREALEIWRLAYVGDLDRVKNMAGGFGFPEYYRFLHEECAGLLSIDSGPLHVGRKLGLPVLSVWGPTHPLNYLYPLRVALSGQNLDHLLYLNAPCSPCVHHSEVLPCGGDNFCIRSISTLQLHEALDQWLASIEDTR